MRYLCRREGTIVQMAHHDVYSSDVVKVPSAPIGRRCDGFISVGIAGIIAVCDQTAIPITGKLSLHVTAVDACANGGVGKHFITRVHKRLEVVVFFESILFGEVGQRVFFQETIVAGSEHGGCEHDD